VESTPQTIHRYEVVRRLGGGGMGVVYLARDPVIGRDVAVKLLRFSDDPDARERFQREVRIAGQLAHPNIVRIYDAGEYQGQPFIAMEYVEGETLDHVIKAGQALELQAKLDLMIDLAEAMAAAHARGIVHRDIKPSNLIIDAHRRLKVLDFGIARVSDTLQTSFSVIGTPNYMAPEQIRGEPVDARCDIFAAGVVLFELVSYRRPFAADNVQALQYRILFEAQPPLSSLAPGIPYSLEQLVDRCLEKQPDRRPQSARELQELLRESRHSLTSEQTSLTAVPHDGPTHLAPDSSKRGSTPRGGTPARGTPSRSTPSRSSASARRVAELRARQLEQLREEARQALTDGRPQDALEAAERALVLDEHDAAAIELAELARQSVERREAAAALADARRLLDLSAVEPAREALGRVRALWATSAELPDLEERLARLEHERAAAAASAPVLAQPPATPAAPAAVGAPSTPAGPPPPAAVGTLPVSAAPPAVTVAPPAAASATGSPAASLSAVLTPPATGDAPVELLLKPPGHGEPSGTDLPDTRPADTRARRGLLLVAAAAAALALGLAAVAGYYFFTRSPNGQSTTTDTVPAATTIPGPGVAGPGTGTVAPPPPPSPPGPPPPVAPGLVPVAIDAHPWARVAITPLGSTPPTRIGTLVTPVAVDLAPGEYELTLENGGVTRRLTRRITVAQDGPASFRFTMPGFTPAAVVDRLMGSDTR
jgi:serine/threonine-protein kinase